MARVVVCDVCKTRHNKFTRATKYMHVKGRKDFRIDLCNVHTFELEKRFPKVSVEYVQFVYKMVHGTELSVENAQLALHNGGRR